MLAVVELDEADYPSNLLLLLAIAIVTIADFGAQEVEKTRFSSRLHNQSAAFDDIGRPCSI